MRSSSGLPIERARLYGMPHIGAFYYNAQTTNGKLEPDAMCAICGRPATNAHHLVPKGIGGGYAWLSSKDGKLQRLRSPLFAVCGMGNMSGCHKLFHDHRITVRWVWDDPRYEQMWWDGELAKPHSDELYNYGCYVIENQGEEVVYRG